MYFLYQFSFYVVFKAKPVLFYTLKSVFLKYKENKVCAKYTKKQ